MRQNQVARQSGRTPRVASQPESRRERLPSVALALLRAICRVVLCGAVATAAAQTAAPPIASEAAASAAMRRALRAPLPPRRPSALSEVPRVEPPPEVAAPRELPPLDTSVPPPSLPRASRSRMRLCALQWLKITEEGRTRGLSWREFATKCLTR